MHDATCCSSGYWFLARGKVPFVHCFDQFQHVILEGWRDFGRVAALWNNRDGNNLELSGEEERVGPNNVPPLNPPLFQKNPPYFP